jgi:hypothetical protein
MAGLAHMADVHMVGIDASGPLNGIGGGHNDQSPSWPNVRAFRQPTAKVVFAGRYFLQTPSGKNYTPTHLWVDGESLGVKNSSPPNFPNPLNKDLAYVVPLQGPGRYPFRRAQGLDDQSGKPVDAKIVQGWGEQDAKAFCASIVAAVKGKDKLQIPTLNGVIVYLDIEAPDPGQPAIRLSPDYWYGWASSIVFYRSGLFCPFWPGIYCPTMHNPDAKGADDLHRIPSSNVTTSPHTDIQTGLTAPPNNLRSICYGIWASNPEEPNRYSQTFTPDWGSPPNSRFDAWEQTVHIIFGRVEWKTKVPVRIWQYAADSSSAPQTFTDCHVDFDETANAYGVNWMLLVP